MNATLPVLNGNRNARFVIPGINLDAFNFTIRSVNRAAKACQPHGHFTTFSLLEILVEPFRRDELLMSQSSIKGLSDMSGVQEPRPDERPKQIAESVRGPYRRRRARTPFWHHQLSEVMTGTLLSIARCRESGTGLGEDEGVVVRVGRGRPPTSTIPIERNETSRSTRRSMRPRRW
jgi:hypothetical protein